MRNPNIALWFVLWCAVGHYVGHYCGCHCEKKDEREIVNGILLTLKGAWRAFAVLVGLEGWKRASTNTQVLNKCRFKMPLSCSDKFKPGLPRLSVCHFRPLPPPPILHTVRDYVIYPATFRAGMLQITVSLFGMLFPVSMLKSVDLFYYFENVYFYVITFLVCFSIYSSNVI